MADKSFPEDRKLPLDSSKSSKSNECVDDRNAIFRGQGFYDLVKRMREVEKRIAEMPNTNELDRAYQDIQNGHVYQMFRFYDELTEKIKLHEKMARILRKMKNELEKEAEENGWNRG